MDAAAWDDEDDLAEDDAGRASQSATDDPVSDDIVNQTSQMLADGYAGVIDWLAQMAKAHGFDAAQFCPGHDEQQEQEPAAAATHGRRLLAGLLLSTLLLQQEFLLHLRHRNQKTSQHVLLLAEVFLSYKMSPKLKEEI